MKPFKSSIFVIATLTIGTVLFTSYEKDEEDNPTPNESQFIRLESPYLICANRNPGDVGFDFEYNGEKGGANNLDFLTADDFPADPAPASTGYIAIEWDFVN